METLLIFIIVIAILAIGYILFYRGIIDAHLFFSLFHLLDCCATIGVFGITFIVTLSVFLLGHSLLVAALAGAGAMAMMFIVLSVAAISYNKTGSQLPGLAGQSEQ